MVFAAAVALAARAEAQSRGAAEAASQAPERTDYLTFAQGAVPIREIIGNGTQEVAKPVNHFAGGWRRGKVPVRWTNRKF